MLPLLAAAALVAVSPDGLEGAERQARVLSSCETALGTGRCELDRGQLAPLRARITESDRALVVELWSDGALVVRRELLFDDGDAPEQREVAAGLLVAALTASNAPRPPEPAPAPAPAPAAPLPPPPSPPKPSEGGWSTEVSALLGTGLSESDGRAGLALRPSLWLRDAVAAHLALGYAQTWKGYPAGTWWDGAIGVTGAPLPTLLPEAWLWVDAVAQRLNAMMGPDLSPAERHAWRWGVRGGASWAWRERGSVGPMLGASGAWMTPPVTVRLDQETVATTPTVEITLYAGLRFGSR